MIRPLLLCCMITLSGCSVPGGFIRSAEEVQADNDRHWAGVERRKAQEAVTTVVDTMPVVIRKTLAERMGNGPVTMYPRPLPEELERLPLGP